MRPEDFPGLAVPRAGAGAATRGRRRMPPGHHSQSERDWAAAGDALRGGEAPETVISRLEQQRQDKPNPGYYARRTVRRKAEELKRGCHDNPGRSITEPQQGQARRTGLKEATVTSRIDSHSLRHSIRLTGIDFEGLNWGQIDPLGAKTSCPKHAPNTKGGLGQL